MADDTRAPRTLLRTGCAAPLAQPAAPAAAAREHAPDARATPRRGGLYAGRDSVYRVLLFVEIDLARDLRRVSGDFFRGEPTEHHVGWFCLPAPQVETSADEIRLEGMGRFTFAALAPLVVVRLPRLPPAAGPDRVSLAFLRSDLDCGAHYLCAPYVARDAEQPDVPARTARVVSLPGARRR